MLHYDASGQHSARIGLAALAIRTRFLRHQRNTILIRCLFECARKRASELSCQRTICSELFAFQGDNISNINNNSIIIPIRLKTNQFCTKLTAKLQTRSRKFQPNERSNEQNRTNPENSTKSKTLSYANAKLESQRDCSERKR